MEKYNQTIYNMQPSCHGCSLEAIQRRTLRIVHPITASMPYWPALHYARLQSLSDRRDKLCRDFFKKMHEPSSCIRRLLPPARDPDLTSRLRRASVIILDLVIEPTVTNHSSTMLKLQ